MAECKVTGLDELIEDMERLGHASDEIAEEMCLLGAETVKEAWKEAAEKHGHKGSGELIKSIDYDHKVKRDGHALSSYIYPRGKQTMVSIKGKTWKRKKPVRRAMIAFVLHYGHGGTPGSHWVDTADKIANEKVPEKLNARWEEFLKNGK